MRWWSRSATDYTQVYGCVLSPAVRECVHVPNCILDGEVIGWDAETKVEIRIYYIKLYIQLHYPFVLYIDIGSPIVDRDDIGKSWENGGGITESQSCQEERQAERMQ